MPLWQADLDWMQQSFTETIQMLVAELGKTSSYFIIKGCSPYKPGAKYLAMDAGWFYWNGEILPVRALSQTDVSSYQNPVVRLTRVAYNNPSGERQFIKPDLTTQTVSNVWKDDYLSPSVVERSASFNNGIRLGVGAWTLSDIIRYHSMPNESGWIMTSNGDTEYKRIGQLVLLRGCVDSENSVQTPSTTGLPAPIVNTAYLPLPGRTQFIKIDSSGQLFLYDRVGIEPSTDGLMYVAASPYQLTDHNTINDNPVI